MDEKIIQMLEEYAADRINQIAENMLEDGCGYSFIARYTGLSEDEVKALKGEPEPQPQTVKLSAPTQTSGPAPGSFEEFEMNSIKAEALRDGAYSVIFDFIDHGMISEEDGANYMGVSQEKFHKRYILNQK